jgi:Secretion system C-terminal sorting domain/Domain of unknown function (DUF4397)
MFLNRITTILALFLSFTVYSQTAKIQIIHNSPTPTVDIYANGTRLLDNFAFRTATPYVDVPAGVTINVGVGLGTSNSVRDTLVNFPVVLQANRRYIAVASGIVGNARTPFRLAISDLGAEVADAPANVGLAFFHGSPDAPAVDVLAGTNVLFGNTAYGNFWRPANPYAFVPANATYQLSVRPAGNTTTTVARYEANLSFWAGKTAVVFASGSLGSQGVDDAFEPWVALSNGGTFPLRVVQAPARPAPTNTARLQIIHNSPTPTVDIYVNGAKLLDDFAFRTATPYTSVPAGVTLNIAVAPANSRTAADAITTIPVRLDSGKTYIAVAYGIVGNATRPFALALSDAGREMSSNRSNVDVNFFHGSPDAPDVDVVVGNAPIFNDIAYSRFGAYQSVPANATYRLAVTPFNNNNQVVARYDLNLGFWAGRTATVIATGFLTGTPSDTRPAFAPYVVLSTGGTFPLSAVTGGGLVDETIEGFVTRKAQTGDFILSPNPAKQQANLNFDLASPSDVQIQIVNAMGAVVQSSKFAGLAKGTHQLPLDLANMPDGYYFVKLQTASGSQTKKLVVAH